MKACTVCGKSKQRRAFYRQGPGHYSGACRPCYRERARGYKSTTKDRRRVQRAAKADELRAIVRAAKDRPCADCSQRYHPCQMDFDHVRGRKRRAVATLAGSNVSANSMLAEIAKCEVVCANCHRLRTFERGQKAIA